MSADPCLPVCKSLIEILKLKLTDRYNDKYKNVIMHLCDAVIIMIEAKSEEDRQYKMIRLNCEALRAAFEYKINPESNYYDTERIKYSKLQIHIFKDELEKHLNHFDASIDPYNVSFLRFEALVTYNCKAVKEIFATNLSCGVIEWYNQMIKYLSHALYEILEWRLLRRYHIRYDVLMKLNSRALKEVLTLKIDAMTVVEKEHNPENNASRTEDLLLKMHKALLQEINFYLQE